jgi:predicted MPP superfamily phosphohydrolase
MKQTFLHLSDLHYKASWFEEQELIYEKFSEDIREQIKGFDKPYLVFSGDLVSAAAETDLFQTISTKLGSLLDGIGVPIERRICIPGNHDVSRTALIGKVTVQKGTLAQITDEEIYIRELEQLNSLLFRAKFEPYVAAEAGFATFTCCQSNVGGRGWELPSGVGVYCLNSATCSFAGLEDPDTRQKISDKERLMVDMRSLHQWLQQTPSSLRVLVMHHPFDWLAPWAKTEIENIVSEKFRLVLSGHIHKGSSVFSTWGAEGAVHCVAPALFTRKRDDLGYSFVTLDTDTGQVDITYRQKTPKHKFVAGVDLAGNDAGIKSFLITNSPVIELEIIRSMSEETLGVLQAEFDEAKINYSSKHAFWVDRDLAAIPETTYQTNRPTFVDPLTLAQTPRNTIIRAPQQYGLTCLGRFIALEHNKLSRKRLIVTCDLAEVPTHRQGVIKYIADRCDELRSNVGVIEALVLDHWQRSSNAEKILRILNAEYPTMPLIILQTFDDFQNIGNAAPIPTAEKYETLYLWSLPRNRIRELVSAYLDAAESRLDEDAVTHKITDDIDALNIHRSPVNCLLLLKLIERSFDDSPVNRTEVISKVLYFLFHEFDKIPTYSIRPDLKDCEYALGYLCEWMIKDGKRSFTQAEFAEQVRQYCTGQMIELDVTVLFSFLVSENILVRKGLQFAFRFSYWLYYFAAHRMYHSPEFAAYIFEDMRYSTFPEVIEFYTGIDRRRTDAVLKLTEDLDRIDAQFLSRTKIDSNMNPLASFLWNPSEDAITKLQQQVVDSIQESALPASIKDAIADIRYDASRPYRQEVAQFINTASVRQMERAMRGAARALRNSDHVSPAARIDLLRAIIRCWIRICQVLMVLSPMLAANRKAAFEDASFYLDKTFDHITDVKERWKTVLTAIVDNVVSWYDTDIFSKKLGPLFANYIQSNEETLGELLMVLLLVRQRPPGWESLVRTFIVRESKNSFYLYKAHTTLWGEFRVGFASEGTRQELRALAAMSVAKHQTGAKKPNLQLIAKMEKAMEEADESSVEETQDGGEG